MPVVAKPNDRLSLFSVWLARLCHPGHCIHLRGVAESRRGLAGNRGSLCVDHAGWVKVGSEEDAAEAETAVRNNDDWLGIAILATVLALVGQLFVKMIVVEDQPAPRTEYRYHGKSR